MSTMAVVTQAESAPAVIRWAARFAKMRGDSLTVIGCLFGQPITAAAPVNTEHPETTEELIQTAAEAMAEIDDLKVQLLLMRNPKPVPTHCPSAKSSGRP